MTTESPTPTPAAEPTTTPAPHVTIPAEVIERLQSEAVSVARAEAEKRANEIVQENNSRIRQAMGDQLQVDHTDEVLGSLLKDPLGVLRNVAISSKEETKRELRAEFAEEERIQRENRKATHAVLGERPDIHSNEAAMKIVSSFWKDANPDLPASEQLKQAVRQYDLLMEKNGAGEAEKRIAAAASLSRSVSTTQESSKGPSIQARTTDVNTSWMERRKEEFKKKHGGQFPSSIRR